MEYLPVFINLKYRSVLVVGGGNVAARKIQMLIRTGANIKIIASKLCPELIDNVKKKKFNLVKHRISSIYVKKSFFSYCCYK